MDRGHGTDAVVSTSTEGTTMQVSPTATLATTATTKHVGVITTRHHASELMALGEYGRRDGYTSLENAVNAMRQLTLGNDRKGVAIFEEDGRYFAQRLLEKAADARHSSGLKGIYLDIEDDSNVRLMPFNQDPSLRAIVDGRKVLYSKFA